MAMQQLVKEDPAYVRKLNPLFRVNPVSKTVSGKKFIIEHRIGRAAGSLTLLKAMQETGLHEQWKKECLNIRKKFGADSEGYEKYAESIFARYKEQMRRMFSDYRAWLERYYEPQGLLPRMAWIPLGENKEATAIFIQSVIDRSTRKLIIGEQEDHALYLWATQKQNKKAHDIYVETVSDTKAFIPQASKELAYQLKQMIEGDIPANVSLLGFGGGGK
jgi:hypothetical protein